MNGVRRIICTMASRCCFFSHIQKKGRPALSSALNKHNDQHIATNTQNQDCTYVVRVWHTSVLAVFPEFHSKLEMSISVLPITWFAVNSSFRILTYLRFAGRTAVYRGCVDWIMAAMTIMQTVTSPVAVRAQPHEDPLSNHWTAQMSCCWNDYARVCQAWAAKAPSVLQVI
jgi:hypothetical protein